MRPKNEKDDREERPIQVVPGGMKRPKSGDPIVWKEGVDSKPATLVEVRSDGDALIHLDVSDFGDNDVAPQSELFLPRPEGTSGRRRRAFPSRSAIAQREGRENGGRPGGRGDVSASAAAHVERAEDEPQPEPEPSPDEPEPETEHAEMTREDIDRATAILRVAVKIGMATTTSLIQELTGQESPSKIVFDALRKSAQGQIDRAQRVLDAVDDLAAALEDSGD